MFHRQCVSTVGREILNLYKQTTAFTCRNYHSVSKMKKIVSGVPSQIPYRIHKTAYSESDFDHERAIEEMERKRSRELNAGEAMKKMHQTKRVAILGTCFLVVITGHLMASMYVYQRKKQIHDLDIATSYNQPAEDDDTDISAKRKVLGY